MALPRPGCLVRGALATLGILFLPLACWFAYANFRRYWTDALSLFLIAVLFLWWAIDRREDSWISAVDDIR